MPLLRKLILPVVLLLLAYAFWQSSNIKQIAAGVAIFLFGMLALEDGFQRLSGGLLERFLRYSTDSLWKSVSFGVVSTSLMQSSSLISVLTISFMSAGLIELAAGIGIIFGANLGTTTGAWLVAGYGLKVKLSVYAMPMLVFGVVLVFQKNKITKGVGWAIAGVGFLLLGIEYMKEGFDAFRDNIDLSVYALSGVKGLLLYTLLGLAATVIMQSSHATLVLIITALAAQQITYENALALSIGANIGTTVTAIIGSLSSNITGKRLAGAHLIFNLTTAIVAILFIKQFLVAVNWISELAGIDKDNFTLQLAVFHTLFNATGVILMLPLVSRLVRFLERVLKEPMTMLKQPKYLNDAAMESSQAALEVVRKESIRLYELSLKVIANGLGWRQSDLLNPDLLLDSNRVYISEETKSVDEAYELRIKNVYSAIVDFVIRAREKVTGPYAENLQVYSRAVRDLAAAIKGIKHLEENLRKYVGSDNPAISYAYNELRGIVAKVIHQVENARVAAESDDISLDLDHALLRIEQDSVTSGTRIESLIRERSITPLMATSLMTDTEYTLDTCRNLVNMAKLMFSGTDSSTLYMDSGVELDKDDMTEILQQQDGQT